MTSTPTPTPAPAPTPPRRRRRWGCLIGLALLALVGITAIVSLLLLRTPPAYVKAYQQFLDSTPPAERKRMGENLQSRLEKTLVPRRLQTDESPLRPLPPGVPDEREITITVNEANAWLSDVLPEWAASQKWNLPAKASAPKVGVEGQNLLLGFRYVTPYLEQDVTLVYRPKLLPDGKFQFVLQGVRGGRLPVPASSIVADILQGNAAEYRKTRMHLLLTALSGEPVDPAGKLPMDATARARLTSFEMLPDGIKLIFRIDR